MIGKKVKKNRKADRKQLRDRIVYHLAKPFFTLSVKKYHYEHGKKVHLKEPTLVVANHTTESDSVFVGTCFYEHMYIVCGEHLMRQNIGKYVKWLVNPVIAPKGGSHLPAVAEMARRLKQGSNVLLFPEGSRSFNGITEEIGEAIGSVARIAGAAVATVRTQGGYFAAPRWAYHFRKGPVSGKVMRILPSEEVKKLSKGELADIINQDLREDAYETQRKARLKYTGKGLAEGLENYLLICPECGSYDSYEASGDLFSCRACGIRGRYTEEGFLEAMPGGKELPFDSVADWGKWMEKRFDEDMESRAPGELLFTEREVRLYRIDASRHTSEDVLTGTLYAYADRLVIGEQEFRFDSVTDAAMLYYGKTLLFSVKEGYFGLTGASFHAWKEARLLGNYLKKYYPRRAGIIF